MCLLADKKSQSTKNYQAYTPLSLTHKKNSLWVNSQN